MDLLDFTDCALYFEAELSPEVEQLMHRAAECYGEPEAELALLRAFLHAPQTQRARNGQRQTITAYNTAPSNKAAAAATSPWVKPWLGVAARCSVQATMGGPMI